VSMPSNATFLNLNLSRLFARLVFAFAALAFCSLLVIIIVSRFVIGTLADERLAVTRSVLEYPVRYFSGSARLNARLARAELAEADADSASALLHAQRAVELSPYDYRFRLTLAAIQEANGDRPGAQKSLESARELAPQHWDVHYRLGNLLLREGKVDQSLVELRAAVAANDDVLPGMLDLVWRASREDVNAVRSVAESSSKTKLTLAQFLLKNSHADEAANVFANIDREDRLASAADSSAFLNSLIAAGKFDTAHQLWSELTGSAQSTLINNGGFESDISKNFAQFDWSFSRTEYARFALDTNVAHGGSRSLRIEFTGQDTTKLDNEVKQLVAVRPGARYRLECYFKTNKLDTPEGPRVVVAEAASSWVGATEPIPAGSNDWRVLTVDFIGPSSSAVIVSIKRKPKFSYDEPTSGTVWFDDFSIKEL
jgi:tetratricopeptide (TPR) repeat protein